MKNDAYDAFVAVRADLDREFAELLADALSAPIYEFEVGRICGALRILQALPYSRGVGNTLHYRLKDAHKLNRARGRPCGCGTLRSCHVEGTGVREILAGVCSDESLQVTDWDIEQALLAVKPRASTPRRPAADYDREGLDAAILAALRATDEEGLMVPQLLELVDHPDATSHRLGARLKQLKRRGQVSSWTFDDDGFERNLWELEDDRAT